MAAIVAAYAVLFVLVCPATPTPTALMTNAWTAPAAAPALVAAVLLLTALLPLSGTVTEPVSARLHPVSEPRLLDLTCARLC